MIVAGIYIIALIGGIYISYITIKNYKADMDRVKEHWQRKEEEKSRKTSDRWIPSSEAGTSSSKNQISKRGDIGIIPKGEKMRLLREEEEEEDEEMDLDAIIPLGL